MRTILSSILLLLFCFSFVLAQENDFQSWNSIVLRKKVFKKTTLSVKTALRLRENASLYSKQFTDVKLRRKYNKRIAYALGYRYANIWANSETIIQKNRFYADINYKNKLSKRFSYSIRNRGQYTGNIQGYKMVFRQKFELGYNIRKTKLSPMFATEYFLSLEDGINKLRSTLGLSYPFSKQLDFELAYQTQQEFYVNNPVTLYILVGKLAYNL